jgi:RimJ/RimL family protein N-acetyltransferase
MDESSAKEISGWKYPEPYSFYDMDEGSAEELTGGGYYAVFERSSGLIGFFCFGEPAKVPPGRKLGFYDDEKALDIGLGLKPELCGKGIGTGFLERGLDFAKVNFGARSFRLTVAAFNMRAAKVYRSAGFKTSGEFSVCRETGVLVFTVMELREYGET